MNKAINLIHRLLSTLTSTGPKMDGSEKFFTSHKSQAVIREMFELIRRDKEDD